MVYGVPIGLMTNYVGDVSTSIVLRYTDPKGQAPSTLDILTNDAASWSDVHKSRLQWEWKAEEHGGPSTAPVLDPFPAPGGDWLGYLFATKGVQDFGADAIQGVAGSAKPYLCSSIPAMLALAATKVKDLGSICLQRYTYTGKLEAPTGSAGASKRGGTTSSANNSSGAIEIYGHGNREIKGLEHIAVTEGTTEFAGTGYVAVVLAFSKHAPENFHRYLWD